MTAIDSSESKLRRLGAGAGIAGAVVTLVAGAVHPKGSSDVGTVGEWMTRVGNSRIWIADHLMLLVGALLLLLASTAIARSFPAGPSRAWAETAWITNVIATAIAVLTFLFDGAVVKNIAELWQTQPHDPGTIGAATLATETGFILVAGLQATSGLVAMMFGLAVIYSTYPRWLGILALTGGAAGFFPGAAHYLVGTSTWSASLVYVSTALITVWFLLMSLRLWRSST